MCHVRAVSRLPQPLQAARWPRSWKSYVQAHCPCIIDACGLLAKLVNTTLDNYTGGSRSDTVCPLLRERLSKIVSNRYLSLRLQSCFGNQATCVSRYMTEGMIIWWWLFWKLVRLASLHVCRDQTASEDGVAARQGHWHSRHKSIRGGN